MNQPIFLLVTTNLPQDIYFLHHPQIIISSHTITTTRHLLRHHHMSHRSNPHSTALFSCLQHHLCQTEQSLQTRTQAGSTERQKPPGRLNMLWKWIPRIRTILSETRMTISSGDILLFRRPQMNITMTYCHASL